MSYTKQLWKEAWKNKAVATLPPRPFPFADWIPLSLQRGDRHGESEMEKEWLDWKRENTTLAATWMYHGVQLLDDDLIGWIYRRNFQLYPLCVEEKKMFEYIQYTEQWERICKLVEKLRKEQQ